LIAASQTIVNGSCPTDAAAVTIRSRWFAGEVETSPDELAPLKVYVA